MGPFLAAVIAAVLPATPASEQTSRAPGAVWTVDAGAPSGGDGSSERPFRTLREGIEAASSGDTVLVAGGRYEGEENRELVFRGKEILLLGADGPGSCVLDCQGAGRAFWISHGEGPAARIQGFTIRGGSVGAGFGGAVLLSQQSSPTFADCVFEGCSAQLGGALLALDGSRPVLERCVFTSNRSSGDGGALFLWGEAVVSDCIFLRNHARRGGALFVQHNAASDGEVVVARSSFRANRASTGGAIGHLSQTQGRSALYIDQCLFAGNAAALLGGAIASICADEPGRPCVSLLEVSSSTLADNAAKSGGAISFEGAGASLGRMSNCIAWGNRGSGSVLYLSGGRFDASWCDLQSGPSAFAVLPSGGGRLATGAGILWRDPGFADPFGPDGDPLTAADNDYALRRASPCIDAGFEGSLALDRSDGDGDGETLEPAPLDLARSPRVRDDPREADLSRALGRVDLGAYELQP